MWSNHRVKLCSYLLVKSWCYKLSKHRYKALWQCWWAEEGQFSGDKREPPTQGPFQNHTASQIWIQIMLKIVGKTERWIHMRPKVLLKPKCKASISLNIWLNECAVTTLHPIRPKLSDRCYFYKFSVLLLTMTRQPNCIWHPPQIEIRNFRMKYLLETNGAGNITLTLRLTKPTERV